MGNKGSVATKFKFITTTMLETVKVFAETQIDVETQIAKENVMWEFIEMDEENLDDGWEVVDDDGWEVVDHVVVSDRECR